MPEAERGRDIVEIGHGVHVDPGLRHRHHHIGVAEAERVDEHDLAVGIRDHLAHQVLAGDAEMDGALRQKLRDLGGRDEGDLDAGQVGDGAAIVARAARLDEIEPGAREERLGVGLQPPLGRHRDDERRAHAAPPHGGERKLSTVANRRLHRARHTLHLSPTGRGSTPSLWRAWVAMTNSALMGRPARR